MPCGDSSGLLCRASSFESQNMIRLLTAKSGYPLEIYLTYGINWMKTQSAVLKSRFVTIT
jgi:hypothetical protein